MLADEIRDIKRFRAGDGFPVLWAIWC